MALWVSQAAAQQPESPHLHAADAPKSSAVRTPFKPEELKEWLDERAFMEGLVNTRFGYLLVFIGLLVPVLFNAEVDVAARAALSAIVTFVTYRVSLTVIRAHFKFRDAIDAIRDRAPDAPVATGYVEYNTENVARKPGWLERFARARTTNSVNHIIGVQLPLLLTGLLFLGTLALVADATGLCKTWLHGNATPLKDTTSNPSGGEGSTRK